MTVSTPARTKALSAGLPSGKGSVSVRSEVRPDKPDERLWKTDEDKAFEAGVRWFLAVSRAA